MRVIVTITREGVRISAPGQPGILLGFDAWDAFLHRARKGWFDQETDDRRTPGDRIGCASHRAFSQEGG
ncbi:hypothetical protein [Streptosporangium sp. CA-115845]|uniref:hypothetical protein n=1 Tax=Streptosporangium sp. CA-115845 TaxID=3240071 RepID=UPI003D918BA1